MRKIKQFSACFLCMMVILLLAGCDREQSEKKAEVNLSWYILSLIHI